MAEYIEREEAMLQIDAADFARDNNFEGGAMTELQVGHTRESGKSRIGVSKSRCHSRRRRKADD